MASEQKAKSFDRLRSALLAVAVIGVIASLALLRYDESAFLRSYLLAFVFWTGLSVGCTGVLMMQFTTGGQWGSVLRPSLTAAGATTPLLALMCIPIMLGIGQLYPWHDATLMSLDPVLSKKTAYLSTGFFVIRSVIYFVVFIAASLLMLIWQRKWAVSGDSRYGLWLERLSGPGMFLLGVVLSLAMIDWVMSLEPQWFSTIYALIWITGNMLAAIAFAAAVRMMTGGELTDKQKKDIGNLLLAFIMMWAYCSFSQYLLIWSGNLREEIPWYLPRTTGAWGVVAIVLIVLHFAFPFLLLLSRSYKQSTLWLTATCVFLLLMRLVDAVWLVDPAFSSGSYWVLLGCDLFWIVVMGAIWGLAFLWIYVRRTTPLETYG